MIRFRGPVLAAYVSLLATLVAGGAGMRFAMAALDVYLRKDPVPLRRDLGSVPGTLGRWQKLGDDQVMDAAMVESLGTDKYLTRNYALDGDPSKGVLMLHLAYYTGMIDTVPHIPERCWGAGGLIQLGQPAVAALKVPALADVPPDAPVNAASGARYPMASVTDPVTRLDERVALPIPGDAGLAAGEVAMTVSAFQDRRNTRVEQIGGYFFIANGRSTASTIGVRSLAFDRTDRSAYFCKVQLSARYPVGDVPPSEAFRAQAEDFLASFLPQLMRLLPDWPAVERQQAPST
jgi:Protein of unknown function (DUF3485)